MKTTVMTFAKAKAEGKKISVLTCYDYTTAKLISESPVDAVLVGDSLGNVILGYSDTICVTLDDMIHHGAAVVRGAGEKMVIVDMPFMTYQTNAYDALVNAGRLMQKTGCGAVKLEGGAAVCPQVKAIVEAGIPVMGHIGLTPQSVNAMGGYRVQGKTAEAAQKLLTDAKALEEAGAFAIVLECVPKEVAQFVTKSIGVPTIGIGAGPACDGQVLVTQDMLSMYGDMKARFVRRFADVGTAMQDAFAAYDAAVKEGTFPSDAESFAADEETIKRLY